MSMVDSAMGTGLKILVVGAGGREHALEWALARSPRTASVHVAPGNAGNRHRVSVAADDIAGLTDYAREHNFDLVVIGPEVVDGKARPLYIYSDKAGEKSGVSA